MTLDRTNWKFGQTNINILVLGIPKIAQNQDNWVYLSGMKYLNKAGDIEYLIVASYDNPTQALEYYRERWQIESMLKAFKTAGFNLEATHLTQYERLDKLLMLNASAFVWAYKGGIYNT